MTDTSTPHTAKTGLPRVTIIVARARNGVIGRGNALPWHLPEDLRHFRATTTGHAVVMGRRTFESIGKPLPGRRNLVLTRDPGWSHAGCERVGSLGDAIELCRDQPEIFVIGGAQVYRAALGLADRMIVTQIDIDADGDAMFAEPDRSAWRQVDSRPGRSESGLSYEIRLFERVSENQYGTTRSC